MKERQREKELIKNQMKSRSCASNSIGGPGQRSISSTCLFRPLPKCSSTSKEGSGSGSSSVPSTSSSHGRPRFSLSAFLDRKLRSTSVVLPIHKDNEGNLSSSLESEHPNGSTAMDDQNRSEGPRKEKGPAIEDSVFKLFSDEHGGKVEEASPVGMTEPERSEGDVKKHGKKLVVVVGDDPKPKRRACGELSGSHKRPRPFYNHYKTGTDWWDSEREGVDEDEVGAKEIWEGMGSTTLGGLEWH